MDKENAQKAWEFLKKNRLATLATISIENNAPQAAFVYFLTDEDFHIYIVTAKDSRKFSNISKNNKVALVIGQEMEPLVLQIEGTAKIEADKSKIHHLSSKYLGVANVNTTTPNWPPVMKLAVDQGYEFIKVTITHFKFSDFVGLDSFIVEGTPENWR